MAMRALDDMELTDVLTCFCDAKGLVDEVIHRVQGKIRELLSSKLESIVAIEDAYKSGLQEIIALLPANAWNRFDLNTLLERFHRECPVGNMGNVLDSFRRIAEDLKSTLKDENEVKGTSKYCVF
jgi:hypothetical protein